MRTIVIFLVILLVGLQYKLWFGSGGVRDLFHLEHKLTVQKAANKKLDAQNRALDADILELKSGDQALEEQARYELGMVKDGEVYYQVTE